MPRIKNGKTFYLIKWEGFDDKNNTWEPEEILNCPKLIQDYEDKIAKIKIRGENKKEKQRLENKCQVRKSSNEKESAPKKGESIKVHSCSDFFMELTFSLIYFVIYLRK